MSVTEDAGLDAVLAHEGVVDRNTPVLRETIDRTVMIRGILRRMALKVSSRGSLTITDAEEDVTLSIEDDSRSVVTAARRVRLEKLLDIVQRAILQTRADDRRRRLGAALRLGVRDVDQTVRAEIGVWNNVQQSTLPSDVDVRQPLDRSGQQFAVTDNPEPARTFGDEHVTVRQKGHGPWVNEALCNSNNAVVVPS